VIKDILIIIIIEEYILQFLLKRHFGRNKRLGPMVWKQIDASKPALTIYLGYDGCEYIKVQKNDRD
jgi:hypothetical protein